jgi:flagellar basal-body rod protein FlgC
MFGSLNISTSGLIAQRTRMETIAANLANKNTVEDANGNYAPFRRRIPIFATGDPTTGSANGVHVDEIMYDPAPFRKVLDPTHPFADKDGYVQMPNIDTTTEMINAIEATRAYEANITAAEATKSMIQSSLRLLG